MTLDKLSMNSTGEAVLFSKAPDGNITVSHGDMSAYASYRSSQSHTPQDDMTFNSQRTDTDNYSFTYQQAAEEPQEIIYGRNLSTGQRWETGSPGTLTGNEKKNQYEVFEESAWSIFLKDIQEKNKVNLTVVSPCAR